MISSLSMTNVGNETTFIEHVGNVSALVTIVAAQHKCAITIEL